MPRYCPTDRPLGRYHSITLAVSQAELAELQALSAEWKAWLVAEGYDPGPASFSGTFRDILLNILKSRRKIAAERAAGKTSEPTFVQTPTGLEGATPAAAPPEPPAVPSPAPAEPPVTLPLLAELPPW